MRLQNQGQTVDQIKYAKLEKIVVRMNRQMRIIRAIWVATAAAVGVLLCFGLPVNGAVIGFAYASGILAGTAMMWYRARRDNRNALGSK